MTLTPHKLFIGDPLNEAAKQVLTTQRDELLAACKALYDYCSCYWAACDVKHDDTEIIEAIDLARVAIAKVEGIDS